MRLLATMCTSRRPADVRGPLAEVTVQAKALEGAEALLVTSGLDRETQAAHDRVGSELGARVLHVGPGLSVARNRALAEADASDVVAFIDDDAVPAADWLERLASHWREAPRDVACIGGAIEPKWEVDPPAWVSARISLAFSLLDLGKGVVELTPSAGEGVWGANISFRAGPLREVGAFDPARGAIPGVPLFGDESDAQRRLEEAGKRIVYAGDVRVTHLVGAGRLTLGGLARRERWRGASLVYAGQRKPLGGVPLALRAGAGIVTAMARFNRPLAGERWARLWREAGVAAAPLMRRRLRKAGWPG